MSEGTEAPDKPANARPTAIRRIAAAVLIAAGLGIGAYYLLSTIFSNTGFVSFSFLTVLPAAVCAFLAYSFDLSGKQGLRFYLLIPVWMLVGVILLSAFLREGVICILMLIPVWLVCGGIGVLLTYIIRKWIDKNDGAYSLTVLLLPLLAIQFEPLIEHPETTTTVTRSVVVEASPEQIWPLLRGITDVRAGEGQWNLSQDVIGIPRPAGARLVGEGIGADRLADWGGGIRFREQITEWRPQRQIGWRFIFDDLKVWAFTDRHLTPDSAYLKITTGGYHLEPLGNNRTRVTLHTRYWMKTPINGYCAMWGELFLGDLETNLLALVKQRAERRDGV